MLLTYKKLEQFMKITTNGSILGEITKVKRHIRILSGRGNKRSISWSGKSNSDNLEAIKASL